MDTGRQTVHRFMAWKRAGLTWWRACGSSAITVHTVQSPIAFTILVIL